MDIENILRIPDDELKFYYPSDAPSDRFDPRFKILRVERRGLREWTSFEEDPAYLNKFKKLPTSHPSNWTPTVFPWNRYLGSETNMVDLLKSTLVLRLNIALNIVSPGISVIGTPKHFRSYGTDDNRLEGGPEVHIGPDLLVFSGELNTCAPPNLRDLEAKIVTLGEAKVKHSDLDKNKEKFLPGTLCCHESWLAQPVQSCIDLNISLGWVQTSQEVVFFHLSKTHDHQSHTATTTRSSNLQLPHLESLSSDVTEEPEFSSPVIRLRNEWLHFDDGDIEIPFIADSNLENMRCLASMRSPNRDLRSSTTSSSRAALRSSLSGVKRTRESTPEEPTSSQQSVGVPPTPCPPPRAAPGDLNAGDYSFSPSHIGAPSPSNWSDDIRAEDPTHVFIKSYSLEDEDVGKRLFELIMLAKRAADLEVLQIGPWKLSHSALDALEA